MSNFSEDIINEVWSKALPVKGYSPNLTRKDACGAWIDYFEYGKQTVRGWQIDHIYPKAKLEKLGVPENKIDCLTNLQALHWMNNESKSDDFPNFKSAISSVGSMNVPNEMTFRITDAKMTDFNLLYYKYLNK